MGTIMRNGIAYGGGGGGLLPHLAIEADPSSTVTVSKGQTSITATETSSGIYECDVAEFGTYTITGELNGASVEGTLVVDTVMVYNYAFTIPVPEGATVTPVNDVQTWLKCAGLDKEYTTLAEVLADEETFDTLLRDSNACDYMARSTAWALAEGLVPVLSADDDKVVSSSAYSGCEKWKAFDGDEDSYFMATSGAGLNDFYLGYDFTNQNIRKVTIKACSTSSGYSYGYSVAIYGSDDLSTFTKISDEQEVLASYGNPISLEFDIDTSVQYKYYILKIASSSASYATYGTTYGLRIYTLQFYSEADITTNADAMARVGKYDYCSEKLLSNATWCEAIINSDYAEEVFNIFVPTMTSNTAPSGSCIASGYLNNDFANYKAFDKNLDTCWGAPSYTISNSWLGYTFPSAVKIRKAIITNANIRGDASYYAIKDFKIQGSNDGFSSDIHDLVLGTVQSATASYKTIVDLSSNTTAYSSYRVLTLNGYTDDRAQVGELQFYGRKSISDIYYPLVPTMTSNTTPSGECFGGSYTDNRYYYYAFTDSNYWQSGNVAGASCFIGYHFPNARIVKKFSIKNYTQAGYAINGFKLQGSNDGQDYVTLGEYTNPNTTGTETLYEVDNNIAYEYYRILVDSTHTANILPIIVQVQFYEKVTKGIIHSAPNDTIYTLDENLDPVILCYTNGEGIGELDYADFGAKNVRLYSSVAKDPSDLTKDFGKIFQITNTIYGGTTEIYLMPDCVRTFYWFGYEDTANLQDISSANGWSGGTFIAPTRYLHYIDNNAGANQFCGVGTSQKHKGTFNVMYMGIRKTSVNSGDIQTRNEKQMADNYIVQGVQFTADVNTLAITTATSSDTERYFDVISFNREARMYALWKENESA